ncbi:SHOCT domain-containing protein [Stieleria mannarensis]|uniref:SHOCT domain-containing protein n=1 Tax=Stieleria mannarensis TaxID=2755585 RepID=UPI00160001C0|nr:SHOCT domain-containing protein [Rhodopirellula sp. JC639]
MPNLSSTGQQIVQSLASRYGLSTDAVTHMLTAVYYGNGSMAQFNHPEFCGSGQWMRGGMTMVSDLFNNNLKNLVDNLCNDIANELANHQTTPFSGSFQSQSQGGMNSQAQSSGQMGSANSLFVPDPTTNWWPRELGTPTSQGSQNSLRYAYFADKHRLAVTTGGTPWVYDTLDHQIGGFSQQQGGGQSILLTSQYGTVDLSTLPVISRDGTIPAPTSMSTDAAPAESQAAPLESQPANVSMPDVPSDSGTPPKSREDVIETLERLGALKDKGYITDEEFANKKSELLARL